MATATSKHADREHRTARRPLLLALSLSALAWGFLGFGGGEAQAQQGGLEPGLIGTWYWEKTTYVGDIIIQSRRWVTLFPNGTFTYRVEGTQTGVLQYRGTVTSRGKVLIARLAGEETLRFPYRLVGSNGLYLDGELYERLR
jgi:hypothetical protein